MNAVAVAIAAALLFWVVLLTRRHRWDAHLKEALHLDPDVSTDRDVDGIRYQLRNERAGFDGVLAVSIQAPSSARFLIRRNPFRIFTPEQRLLDDDDFTHEFVVSTPFPKDTFAILAALEIRAAIRAVFRASAEALDCEGGRLTARWKTRLSRGPSQSAIEDVVRDLHTAIAFFPKSPPREISFEHDVAWQSAERVRQINNVVFTGESAILLAWALHDAVFDRTLQSVLSEPLRYAIAAAVSGLIAILGLRWCRSQLDAVHTVRLYGACSATAALLPISVVLLLTFLG